MLGVSTAVARHQENDVLWAPVAAACSDALKHNWFGRGEYPLPECRESLRDACSILGLRNQLHLRGKMHYWRTVMLQFGFNPQVACRQLPNWLAGYVLPETVRTLLNPGDDNSSISFQRYWAILRKAAAGCTSAEFDAQLANSAWCPAESRAMLWAGLRKAHTNKQATSIGRIEDEDRNPTIFGVPRLSNSEFTLSLSHVLPKEFMTSDARRLILSMQGLPPAPIVRDPDGHFVLDGGSVHLPVREVLKQPEREVKIAMPRHGIYRERFAFWDESEDVVLFAGIQGRRVLDTTNAELNLQKPYSLVVRADLQVRNGSQIICHEERSQSWAIYRFPEGLPMGLGVFAGEELLWTPRQRRSGENQSAFRCKVSATELSPSRLRVRVTLAEGWICEWFRFAGRGYAGACADIHVAPNFRYGHGLVLVQARRGQDYGHAKVNVEFSGPPASGAAYQSDDGQWNDLHGALPLDAGTLEGRPLACRWRSGSEQEVWLMLGDQPVFAEPDVVRRQEIACCGEPLYLRFGLMHEDHMARVPLASAVYSTSLLAAVEIKQGDFLLRLREPVERAGEFRVWVWERNKHVPRCVDPSEVQALDEATLFVLADSAAEPLGWLLSWEGMWRGARFHVEPTTTAWHSLAESWCHILDQTPDWNATAKALRAWRFPVLMPPFKDSVQKRAAQSPLLTLDAWTSRKPLLHDASGAYVSGGVVDYAVPIRECVPVLPSDEYVAQELLEEHVSAILASDWQNNFYEPAAALLRAQPVLLAQLLVACIKNQFALRERLINVVSIHGVFHKQPDPKQLDELRKSTELVAKVVIAQLCAYAGATSPSAKPEDLSLLEEAALNDLRSWVDNAPVDGKFFRLCVTEPSDRLFSGEHAELKWLRLAIARSAVCCAFVAAHLVCRSLYRALKDGAL